MQLPIFQPTITLIEEPMIKLREDLSFPEPKMGWTLAGVPGTEAGTIHITLGMIGDTESLEDCTNMLERIKRESYGKSKGLLHIDFPGTNNLKIDFDIRYKAEITPDEIKKIENTGNISDRISKAGEIIRAKMAALADRDPRPDLLLLPYPARVDMLCIKGAVGHRKLQPKTEFQKEVEKKMRENYTLEKWGGPATPVISFKAMDLRCLVKAAAMDLDIPVQIIRPVMTDVYDPNRPRREDDATAFWNLLVAMFYKSNHLPWEVKGLSSDTCYVGVSFYRDRNDSGTMKTSLSQVFSLNTEGFVFKGNTAITDENRSPHVAKEDAIEIVQKAIEVYKRSNDGNLPRRLVIHKTSRFNKDELEGFGHAAREINKVDMLAFGVRDIKLIRWGKEPPIRGTCIRLPDNSIILYTFGYIPYVDAYPGPRVPAPLQILEHHGSSSKEDICKEIMALTKLNWNNAKYCSRSPVTIAFAQRVGAILRQSPATTNFKDRIKYYM